MERPSKAKFVRDMMRGLAERESDRKEAEAQAQIDQYCSYRNNQSYRGKKKTLWQYQS